MKKPTMAALAVLGAFTLVVGPAEARGGGGSRVSGTYSGTGSNSGSHYTRGYTTNRSTYVAPHHSTNPNATRRDNYEARGNHNPHTGAYGSRLVDR